MDKPYGLRGELEPKWMFQGLEETLVNDGITITVKESVLEVGYDNETDEQAARELVKLYLFNQTRNTNFKVTATLNQSWRIENNKKKFAIGLDAAIKPSGQVRIASADVETRASIAPANIYDSRSLHNSTDIVKKALEDKPLAKALEYYADEVVDADRPLYGIYKALEELAKHLDGRDKLGQLAGQNEKYVDDVMQTTQIARHYSGVRASRILSDDECRERANILIEAYANSL